MGYELKRGDRVAGYKIVSKLGQGGFGITYRAIDKMRREVAIKEYFPAKLATRSNGKVLAVTHSTYEDYARGLKQFHREARFIAKFDHLNIVRILHVFEQNGTAYIVTRYEHGMDLNRYMHERLKRPLNYSEIAVFFTAILDGLRTVHKKGVLHLDIKPSNILIRRDAVSSPCLIDFGGARHSAAQASFEADGKFNFAVATDGYSPPEQYDTTETEKSRDPRADVYALGATMYTCMVGQEVLKRSTNRLVSMTNQNFDPVVPAIKRFEGRYPPALLELVDSCHSIRKDLRPKDAETIQHRLVKIVNDEKRRYERRKQSPEKGFSRFETNVVDSDEIRGRKTNMVGLPPFPEGNPNKTAYVSEPLQQQPQPAYNNANNINNRGTIRDPLIYAGFWPRVGAYIIDIVILSAIFLLLIYLFQDQLDSFLINSSDMESLLLINALSILLNWLYYASMESSKAGGTIGKRLVGIRVVDHSWQRISFWRATGRFLSKILSGLILGIGFLMAGFTSKKQALHDLIADTLVIRR